MAGTVTRHIGSPPYGCTVKWDNDCDNGYYWHSLEVTSKDQAMINIQYDLRDASLKLLDALRTGVVPSKDTEFLIAVLESHSIIKWVGKKAYISRDAATYLKARWQKESVSVYPG